MNPKITIVTVVYNAASVLEHTMRSVLLQNYDNIEYIVIDGGSHDGSIDIIKKYSERLAYWISEPDKGIYYAMNKAIQKATGAWINFMNAGDYFYAADTVEKMIPYLDVKNDVVYGNVVNYFEDHEFRLAEAGTIEQVIECLPFCHQSTFVRTELMKIGFDTSFRVLGDLDFFLKMAQQHKHFVKTPIPVAIYALGGYSANSKYMLKEVRRLLGIKKFLVAKIKQMIIKSIFNDIVRKILNYSRVGTHIDYQDWIKPEIKL